MDRSLTFDLHALTARLDRAADRILRAELDISYARFRALLSVDNLARPTQRVLAEQLGTTEPSVSRMTAVLRDAGLLEVVEEPGAGRRNSLALTSSGRALLNKSSDLLEGRFAALVEHAGVDYPSYHRDTRLLLHAMVDEPDR